MVNTFASIAAITKGEGKPERGLFLDEAELEAMAARYATAGWPGFRADFLLQPAPRCLVPDYPAQRLLDGRLVPWRGRDTKYAAWLITENAMAWRLGGDARHEAAARAWVEAALASAEWGRAHTEYTRANCDLHYGNLAYAVAFFLDLLGSRLEPAFRRRVEDKLARHARLAADYFLERSASAYPYTQNHFYIPLTGLLCSLLALGERSPVAPEERARLEAFLPLLFGTLSRDGWYYEGFGYFHYAYVWLVRLAELSRRHLGFRADGLPCFAELAHYVHWMTFPKGREHFRFGDDSFKDLSYASWEEGGDPVRDPGDVRQQDHTHLLYWVSRRTGDLFPAIVADAVLRRGGRPNEGFWCLAWQGEAAAEANIAPVPAESHHFADAGVWFAERRGAEQTLRVAARCGPPMGHALPLDGRRPPYAVNAGHAHPDAGTVLAAVDDVPIIAGPGYLGIKRGAYLNTITFDGAGQQDDRFYHAMNPEHADYARLRGLRCAPDDDGAGVTMDFAAAYAEALGVRSARRRVMLPDAGGFVVEDFLETDVPRRAEARLRITDAPRLDGLSASWRVGPWRMRWELLESSAPCRLFCAPGDVVTINEEPEGTLETGRVNQRGYQLILRPEAPQSRLRWRFRISARRDADLLEGGG